MASRVIDVTMQLIDKVTEPLGGISGKLQDSARQWQTAGKDITRTGKDITKAGQALTTGITLPVVGAATAAVKTAADFEAGMSKVAAISGATGDDMASLNDKAEEMGRKTKFSATEAADAFSYMAMAGWKTEQMMSGIEGVMYLAGATGEDLAQTSDIVTDAMTAFGMAADGTSKVLVDGVETEVSNVTRFVDVMAAAANNANTNVSMLGESFKYVAPVAGSLGYDVEDVSVALGVMANSGIKASQGGTALRSLLTNMAKQPGEVGAAMERLGVSLEDGQGNMLSFAEVMQDLRRGFGELKLSHEEISEAMDAWGSALEAGEVSEDDYNTAMEELMENALGAEGAMKAEAAATLAGKTGMAGLLAIVNSSDEDFNKLTDAIYNSNGACEDMYNITQDNLIGRLTILKSGIESLAISFGNILIPYVEKGVEWLQGMVDKFSALDPETKNQIVRFAAFAAAIGPILLGVGKVTTTIGGLVTGIGRFGMALKTAGSFGALLTGPGAIVVGVIVAIIAVVALLVTHWDQVKTGVQTAMDAVKMKLGEAGLTVGFFKEKLQPLIDKFNEIKEKVIAGWNLVKPFLQAAMNFVVGVVIARVKLGIDSFLATFKFVFNIIVALVDRLLRVFNDFLDFITGVFTGDWELAWNAISDIFSSAIDFWKEVFSGFFDWISELLGGIAEFIGSIFAGIGNLGSAIAGAFSGGGSESGAGASGAPAGMSGYATGTSYFRGGLARVNEEGGEIMDLPRGTRIYPHDQSLKMAYNQGKNNAGSQGAGRGGNVTINIPKLADSISVRSDSDIDAIATAIASKLESTSQNLGGGQIGYVY